MSYVGRIEQSTLLNRTSGKNALKQNIANLRRNYQYPAWFENTIKWTESGQVSEAEFYRAVDNLSSRGEMKLKVNRTPTTPKLIPNPNAPAYKRPTFAHDTDQYGYDYLYGERDFKSDQDIWNKFAQLKTKREEMQSYIDTKIEGLYDTRRSKNEVEQIIIDYYGDDIRRLNEGHASQEKSISGKSGKDHKHKNGGGEDCGWFGEKCWFPDFEIPTWLKLLGAAIGIGLLLWLIRPLLKIGANVTK